MTDLIALREAAAIAVFESGTVQIDLDKGFKIKAHDKFKDAPRSPFYASLRPQGVKDGQLTSEDFMHIGRALSAKARQAQLLRRRAVVGIPQAGEPLTDAFLASLTLEEAELLNRKRLTKKVYPDGTRKISGFVGEVTSEEINDMLVLDDLMTQAETKMETHGQIKGAGGTMTDLLLFMSRSKHGVRDLKQIGVRTHVVWDFDPLMEFWLAKKYISRKEYEAIMNYPDQLAEYISRHA